ncbi:MAG: hypothetical protein DMF20_02400 [Verrucomicrobia bacterium]|nr:MAG: hypothetical protein DMF20_02400 [Verrucomicrobiota bacterium]
MAICPARKHGTGRVPPIGGLSVPFLNLPARSLRLGIKKFKKNLKFFEMSGRRIFRKGERN